MRRSPYLVLDESVESYVGGDHRGEHRDDCLLDARDGEGHCGEDLGQADLVYDVLEDADRVLRQSTQGLGGT